MILIDLKARETLKTVGVWLSKKHCGRGVFKFRMAILGCGLVKLPR